MDKAKKAEELKKLREKKEALDKKIASIEAKEKKEKRKKEDKQKILVGAYFLTKFEKEGKMNELHKIMDGFLSRPADRKAFDLDQNPPSGKE